MGESELFDPSQACPLADVNAFEANELDEIRTGLSRVRATGTEASIDFVVEHLDATATRWSKARDRACADEAAHAIECLDAAREQFDVTAHILSHPDPLAARQSYDVAMVLEGSVDTCRDGDGPKRLLIAETDDPELTRRADMTLARARVLTAAGAPDATTVLAEAIDLSRDSGCPVRQAGALGLASFEAQSADRFPSSARLAREALARGKDLGWPGLEIDAHMLIGRAHSAAGRHDDALKEMDIAVGMAREHARPSDPRVVEARLNRAGALVQARKLERALTETKELLRILPRDRTALEDERIGCFAAQILGELGRSDEVVDLCEKRLRRSARRRGWDHPEDIQSLGVLANAYAGQGDVKRAKEHFATIFTLTATDPTTVHMIAFAHMQYGDLERVRKDRREHYEKALAIAKTELRDSPLVGVAHGRLGAAAMADGDSENAIVHFEQELEVFTRLLGDEATGEVHAKLARVHLLRGDHERARREAERALALLPADAIPAAQVRAAAEDVLAEVRSTPRGRAR